VDGAEPPPSSDYLVGRPVVLKIPLDALKSQNDIVAVENPFGVEVCIIEAIFHTKVVGTDASAVVDVDIVADATSTGDDIFDGIDITSLTTVSMLEVGAGSNAEHTGQIWNKAGGSNDFVTAKLLAADGTAFEGDLLLVCVPMAE
jgi:hypothetical protein